MTQFTLGLTNGVSHGPAFSQVLNVTSPAAGAGFTYTNSGRYWERVVSLAFRLVSDGNAADRQVLLTATDGGGVPLAAFPAASVQAATLTYDYYFLSNVDTFNQVVATSVVSPVFAGFLQPSYTLAVTIGSVQVGDAISRIRLYVERFVTGPEGYLLGIVEMPDKEAAEAFTWARVAA